MPSPLALLKLPAGRVAWRKDALKLLGWADQRGYPRTANGAGTTRCDIGAFEVQRIVDLPLARG